ncbi:HEAT repeat domain-containing protein [Dactylosporangium sp. NPDC048998]|uniref:HEAT repeat domain-containing protein n=1 Tax=Dactylosporangium sp. NPDC048998 TaxID=3363976 RepID=UPI003713DF93
MQLAEHGSQVWAAPRPQLRRAHQKAVLALARLGDTRALPSLLVALDSGVDALLAIQVAGALPQAAEQLVPRLCDHLRRVDLADQWQETSANANLHALAKLGDPTALTAITEALAAAARHERWSPVCSALEALGALGPAAAPALDAIRSLSTVEKFWVRPTAVAALWAVSGDREEVMPLLLDLLNGYAAQAAADVLGQIGPSAAAALPRLRHLLTDKYEWVRVHCAAALWEVGGEPEAPAVVDTLLQAWTENSATGNQVVACLTRMIEACAD